MARTNRRTFLGLAGGAVAGAALYGGTDLLRASSADAANVDDTTSAGDEEMLTAFSTPAIDGPASPVATELTPFRDPLRIPPTLKPSMHRLTGVRMTEAHIRLHSQLPPTRMWTYEGVYPGPTIEVRSGEKIRIAWENQLQGTTPVKAVIVPPQGPPPGLLPNNSPGSSGAARRPDIDALTPLTTVHLHGGHHHAINDGAPDSGVTPGSAQLAEYLNNEAAAHLFYHDHSMPITAVNVMSGLMGNYLVRDVTEDRLDLPRGEYEIPLMISDVNFDTGAGGRLDGQLLDKRVALGPIDPDRPPPLVAFFGPYTMVNGVVWPKLQVEATAYRFRVINISIARSYSLVLIDESTGKPVRGAMKVISTDMGLLGEPKTIDETLTLNPAERADIVIDFAAFAGRKLTLVNTVPGVPPGTPVLPAAMPYPQVMQFHVDDDARAPFVLPRTLDPGFKQLSYTDLPAGTAERFTLFALDVSTGSPMLKMNELLEVDASTPSGRGIVQVALPGGTRTFRIAASGFEDTTNYFAASASWVKWTVINILPPGILLTHPLHIHMLNFQLLRRDAVDGSVYNPALGATTAPITIQSEIPIAPEESGWKDTVGIPQNSVVTIGGQFGSQTGRFMYHCHILDHEDEGMMRPHVLMPPSVLAIKNMM